jgi:cyclophilin family peptidyl-prolyl cis-trans isomerase
MTQRSLLLVAPFLLLLFGGCRSRDPLVLYKPGDREVWRTEAATPAPAAAQARPRVILDTSHGAITVELFPHEAPETVANFLRYVDSGFFNGTIFHRVIPGFMIQGGGVTLQMEEKPTGPPIRNESGNNLRNTRGTLAMARTHEPHSATAQFFINLVDNPFLNGDGVTDGYAVFGRVYEGMPVVDTISMVETTILGTHQHVPVEPVLIRSVRRAP